MTTVTITQNITELSTALHFIAQHGVNVNVSPADSITLINHVNSLYHTLVTYVGIAMTFLVAMYGIATFKGIFDVNKLKEDLRKDFNEILANSLNEMNTNFNKKIESSKKELQAEFTYELSKAKVEMWLLSLDQRFMAKDYDLVIDVYWYLLGIMTKVDSIYFLDEIEVKWWNIIINCLKKNLVEHKDNIQGRDLNSTLDKIKNTINTLKSTHRDEKLLDLISPLWDELEKLYTKPSTRD